MNVADYLLEHSQDLDKNFIDGTKQTFSYADLHTQVNACAAFLHTRFGEEKEILLMAENSFFFIVSYLAIIKSRNVAVLVETKISPSAFADLVTHCSVAGFLVQEKFRTKVPENYPVYTETLLREANVSRGSFRVPTGDQDTAVIVFTSGSTGSKKGVMLTHRNIRVNTESIIQYLNLSEKDRIEVVLPFFYCYGASLLHTHLRVCGSIVLNNSIFLGSIIDDLNTYQCTGFAGVPSTYLILMSKTNFLQKKFPSLRYFTQAGGKLANNHILRILQAFPDKLFYVMYGATEATARLSYLPPELAQRKLGSIGRGIPGVELEVLDEEGRPVAPGAEGEVTARGENIMKGYYRDTQATALALREGRYYTGDLAIVDTDGYIFITGRKSNFIKSAGYRISPNEIEDIIASVEGVSQCVVLGIPDDIMGEAVTVAVSCTQETATVKAAIMTRCINDLPSYKVPKYLIFLKELPLNASNKFDTHAIRKLIEKEKELLSA